MAQNGKTRESFANKFYGTVTESAANTLTFAEIQTNVDVFAKIAWVLHRLEWNFQVAVGTMFQGNADRVRMAITSSDNITDLELDNPAVIDRADIEMRESTAVGFSFFYRPFIRDFASLPGGGIIMAPRPLFVGVHGVSLVAAATVEVRGYFTKRDLTADEYLELVDFYRIVR